MNCRTYRQDIFTVFTTGFKPFSSTSQFHIQQLLCAQPFQVSVPGSSPASNFTIYIFLQPSASHESDEVDYCYVSTYYNAFVSVYPSLVFYNWPPSSNPSSVVFYPPVPAWLDVYLPQILDLIIVEIGSWSCGNYLHFMHISFFFLRISSNNLCFINAFLKLAQCVNHWNGKPLE